MLPKQPIHLFPLTFLVREAQEIANSPSPDFTAAPLESDLFEWHFTMRGPPGSPYGGGIYHGRITLPPNYPLRPPNFRFVTPSGRFETNREICLSMSSHHEETWQPAWGIRTALLALRSFMDTSPDGQLGSLNTTKDRKMLLATQSRSFKCAICNQTNAEIIAQCEKAAREAGESGLQLQEIEIPPELQLGYKDELSKAEISSKNGKGVTSPAPEAGPASLASIQATRAAPTGQHPRVAARSDSLDSEAAILAEGFVTTTSQATAPATSTQEGVRARPVHGVPRPTAQTRSGDIAFEQRRHLIPIEWIDRVIYMLTAVLIVMVLKILMP